MDYLSLNLIMHWLFCDELAVELVILGLQIFKSEMNRIAL